MFETKKWPVYLLCAIVCLLMSVVACDKRPNVNELKDSLGKVAEQYWTKRLIKGDYEYTYDLEAEKGSTPYSEYLKSVKSFGQIEFLSIKVKEISIDNDKGTVLLTLGFKLPQVNMIHEQTMKDKWIYTSKGWRHEAQAKRKS